MVDNSQIMENWIKALIQAYYDLKPLNSLSYNFGNLSVEEAYEVQFKLLDEKIKNGEHLIGWKIGATSQVVRKSLPYPVSEPRIGLDD